MRGVDMNGDTDNIKGNSVAPNPGGVESEGGNMLKRLAEEAERTRENGELHKYPSGWPSRYPLVYEFYNNIFPEIRRRQLGVKRLPQKELEALKNMMNVEVGNLDSGVEDGRYIPWFIPFYGNSVDINKSRSNYDQQLALTHELRHYLQFNGIPSASKDLDSVYHFPRIYKGNLLYNKSLELGTTNTQHQFSIFNDMAQRLGRAPTAKEYFNEIGNYDDYKLKERRRNIVNEYQGEADESIKSIFRAKALDAEAYRRALMSIANNNKSEAARRA